MELEKKLKRLGSNQLLSKYKAETSVDKKAVMEKILISRGILQETPKKEDKPEVNTKHPNVGKTCTFIPFRKEAEVGGTIKAHVHDRRVSRKYYRIQGEDGKIYHKKTDSTQLTIDG